MVDKEKSISYRLWNVFVLDDEMTQLKKAYDEIEKMKMMYAEKLKIEEVRS